MGEIRFEYINMLKGWYIQKMKICISRTCVILFSVKHRSKFVKIIMATSFHEKKVNEN